MGDLKRSEPAKKDKANALRNRAGTGGTGDRAGGLEGANRRFATGSQIPPLRK